MFTVCPGCKLDLAVSPGDLRIGQGYVRCGRCERVFNALLALSEDPEREQPPGAVATGTASMPALEQSATHEAAPLESTSRSSTPDTAARAGEWSKITPIHQLAPMDMDVVETMATGTFETIVLEGDSVLQTEEHVDEQEVDLQLREIADQIDADELAQLRQGLRVEEHSGENLEIDYADHAVIEPDFEPEYESEFESESESEEPLFIDADTFSPVRGRAHWAWVAATAALLLLLLTQIVHHHRQQLVSLSALQGPLQGLYGLFGVRLDPRWDLNAYDLRQLGGEAPGGTATTVVVRASVHNRARHSQPPPMIRVQLQDRFGNTLSTVAVAPQDYLRTAPPARMRPDQRLDAELTVEDPQGQAVGFELDACLPGGDGKLHCSTDPAA